MRDELGDRMKKYYEDRTRILLPRRTYTIIRIDGKAFHTYTHGLKRPFDNGLVDDMDATACYLCKNIQGAKFAFVQSDEISVLMTDFEAITTDAWFDGNIQKIASIAASLTTARFNQLRTIRWFTENGLSGNGTAIDVENIKIAAFDARVFTIPTKTEVANMFIWRMQDTVRNSISSVAQTLYSHKELEGKNMSEQQEMIFQKGINWNDYAPKYKRGRFIEKQLIEKTTDKLSPYIKDAKFIRSVWVSIEPPIFTQDTEFLLSRIPDNS
jgi:tRNA(His) 5'-end guanylyltransferase